MARTLAQTGMNFPNVMYRRRKSGEVVPTRFTEDDRKDYVVPKPGIRCRFKLTGLSEDYEEENRFEEGEMRNLIMAEYGVVKGYSNAGKIIEGKRFWVVETNSASQKAKLAQLFSAFLGRPYTPGDDIDQFIGIEFDAMTEGQENNPEKFKRINAASIERDSIAWPDDPRAEAEPGGATGPEPGADPFLDEAGGGAAFDF